MMLTIAKSKRPDTRVHCTRSLIHEEERGIEDQEDLDDELRGKPVPRLFIHAFAQATHVVLGLQEPEGKSGQGLVAVLALGRRRSSTPGHPRPPAPADGVVTGSVCRHTISGSTRTAT